MSADDALAAQVAEIVVDADDQNNCAIAEAATADVTLFSLSQRRANRRIGCQRRERSDHFGCRHRVVLARTATRTWQPPATGGISVAHRRSQRRARWRVNVYNIHSIFYNTTACQNKDAINADRSHSK